MYSMDYDLLDTPIPPRAPDNTNIFKIILTVLVFILILLVVEFILGLWLFLALRPTVEHLITQWEEAFTLIEKLAALIG
jgi:hypothetical protein